jgi:hypothetical protein
VEYELEEMEGDREMDTCETDRELESVVKSSVVGVSISVAERREGGKAGTGVKGGNGE